MQTKLFNFNFLLYLQGRVVTNLAFPFYVVVIVLWLKQSAESATLAGSIFVIWGLTSALFSPFAGVIADRYSRKWLVVICDLVAGLSTMMVAATMFLWPDNIQLILALFIVDCLINGVSQSMFTSAASALLPDLVGKRHLQAANGITDGLMQSSYMIGQALAGWFYRIAGAPIMILTTALGLCFSALSESFITENSPPTRDKSKQQQTAGSLKRFTNELGVGITALNNLVGAKPLIVAMMLTAIVGFPTIVMLPYYLDLHLNVGEQWLGYMLAADSGGWAIGALAAGSMKTSAATRSRVMVCCLAMQPLAFLVMGFTTTASIALVAFFARNMLVGAVYTLFHTAIQVHTPAEKLGRVTSIFATLLGLAYTPFFLFTGIAVDQLGSSVALLFYVAAGITTAGAMAVLLSRSARLFIAFNTDEIETLENSD